MKNSLVKNGEIKILVKNVLVEGRGAIILTGPSSCGKGEIAKELRKFLSIPEERHLSMGDILRNTIKKAREDSNFRRVLGDDYNIHDEISVFDQNVNDSDLYLKAIKYKDELNEIYFGKETISQLEWLEFCVSNGLLIPDEWTVNIINATFESSDDLRNSIFILDGYPRTNEAARSLIDTFIKFDIPVVKVIHLSITKDEMIKRALGRKRMDDDVVSLERRYQFYVENVQPSIDYIKDHLGASKVTLIDAHQPVYDDDGQLIIEDSIKRVVTDVLHSLGLPEYLLDL